MRLGLHTGNVESRYHIRFSLDERKRELNGSLFFDMFWGSPQSIWNKHRSIGSTLWGYLMDAYMDRESDYVAKFCYIRDTLNAGFLETWTRQAFRITEG